MPQPQVEKLPSFILEEGRKDLAQVKVSFLRNMISRMRLVNAEDQADALNRIGVIYVYLNECEQALDVFQKSLSLELCEMTFSNYIQTLERLGKFEQAIKEGLNFLESNPNNRRVFYTLLDIVTKYPNIKFIEDMLKYFKFHFEAEELIEAETKFRSDAQNELEILEMLEVDLEYFNLITNIAFLEVKKIQVGFLNFHSYLNDETGQLNINVVAKGINKEDIKVLNRNFDDRIQSLIDKGVISFDKYIDHLMKFTFGFGVAKLSQQAA
jgi:tetratricopeptide (TPR) repeat protein